MPPVLKDYARMIAVAVTLLIVFGIGGMVVQRSNGTEAVAPIQATPLASADRELLVDVAWLAERLASGTPPLVIDVGDPEQYLLEHIPGAIHLPWQDTMNLNGAGYGEAFGLASRASYRPETGARQDDVIVVYDNNTSTYASRVVWQLRTSGYTGAAVLDGGLAAWKGAGHPVSDMTATPAPVPSPTDIWLHENEITTGELAERLSDPQLVLIDTRNDEERQDTINDTIRQGQIPGSVSLPSSEVMRADGTFASPAELEKIFAPLGLSQEDDIVVYGRFGTETGPVWLALRLAGFENVRVYDDGWIAWGHKDATLPIEPLATPTP